MPMPRHHRELMMAANAVCLDGRVTESERARLQAAVDAVDGAVGETPLRRLRDRAAAVLSGAGVVAELRAALLAYSAAAGAVARAEEDWGRAGAITTSAAVAAQAMGE